MGSKRVFVTVGTTKFPELINKITTEKVLRTFLSLGYGFIQVQTGKDFNTVHIPEDTSLRYTIKVVDKSVVVEFENKLIIKYDSYFDNFEEEILKSDLIISHAGAGTCLEVLRKNKPLLVVINEKLMDNHQEELAETLQTNGYLYYSTCDTLPDVLKKDFSLLKIYPQPQKTVFANYLDKCMGFVMN